MAEQLAAVDGETHQEQMHRLRQASALDEPLPSAAQAAQQESNPAEGTGQRRRSRPGKRQRIAQRQQAQKESDHRKVRPEQVRAHGSICKS